MFHSVPQLDELDGRVAAHQLAVLRSGRRFGHLPAVRHHQAGHRHLVEGAQAFLAVASFHGEAGELQLCGRFGQAAEVLAGRNRRTGFERGQCDADVR